MKSLARLSGLAMAICLVCPTANAAGSHVIPQTNSLDVHGDRLYVYDAALRAAVPELSAAGERSGTCANSAMTPPYLFLDFEPIVTGPHEARIAKVTCTFDSKQAKFTGTGNLTCDEVRFLPVEFEDDLAHFFRHDETVEAGEARELFHALLAGLLPSADSTREPTLDASREVFVSKEGGLLRLVWGQCGCKRILHVEHRPDDPDKPFITRESNIRCI